MGSEPEKHSLLGKLKEKAEWPQGSHKCHSEDLSVSWSRGALEFRPLLAFREPRSLRGIESCPRECSGLGVDPLHF